MLRIKAIAAIALTGLGSATLGTDVYLASRAKAPPKQEVVEQAIPVRAMPEPVVVAPAFPPEPVLMLPPVTLYARDRSRHAARQAAPVEEPKEQGLVACSDWR